nr:hypothetical protein [Tanacetum cinerariifolium]
MHASIEWKLYDLSGVHQVTAKDKEIFMLVEKDYPLRKGLALVMICYKLQVENFSQMANDLVLKIYKIANSPRQQGYAVLGIKHTRFLVKSRCRYAVSYLLDTAYVVRIKAVDKNGRPRIKGTSLSSVRAGGQYLFRNLDFRVFQLVIEPNGSFLSQRLAALVRDMGKARSIICLPPEWSKFVTNVKLVKDLHTINFDQLHAYLEQNKLHANEAHLLRKLNQNPLAFVANQQMTPPYFNTYQSSYNNPQLQQQFPPSQYESIHPTQHYSSTYPLQPEFNHSSVPPSYQYQS